MKRRAFIAALGGAAAWPLLARAQQPQAILHIGFLSPFSENDLETQARLGAFKQRLKELGWLEGVNIEIHYRFSAGGFDRTRAAAADLVALKPDVIFAYANPAVAALKPLTQTIPIIFTQVGDAVGSGFVANVARPGGNITGFHSFESSMGGKWLELLKEIAPHVRRAAILYDPTIAANVAFARSAEEASTAIAIPVFQTPVKSATDIERGIFEFANSADGGMVIMPAPSTFDGRDLIVELANRFRLPAIYSYRFFVMSGGLVSYGYEGVEQFQKAAVYIDRIFRGAHPAELPVESPTKYQLVVNLAAAKAIKLKVPDGFLLRADEVIE